MKCVFRSDGRCSHCGRTDKPLETLVPLRFGRPYGQDKHLCPRCLEAVAEVAWIVTETARR